MIARLTADLASGAPPEDEVRLRTSEKDAANIALRIAGAAPEQVAELRSTGLQYGEIPYPSTLTRGRVIEDELIAYDAERFFGIAPQSTDRIGVKRFPLPGGSCVDVFNANRTSAGLVAVNRRRTHVGNGGRVWSQPELG